MSNTSGLYEQDFYAWATENARLIRQGRLADIDLEHVAEELDSMGRSERRELVSRMTQLLLHLLKWQFQPALRSKSWHLSIRNQRIEIDKLLGDSPSLKSRIEAAYEDAYGDAVSLAEIETGIDKSQFPPRCPFSLQQALDREFLPE